MYTTEHIHVYMYTDKMLTEFFPNWHHF